MASLLSLPRSLYFERAGWLYLASFGGDGSLQTPRRLGKLPRDSSDSRTVEWAVSQGEQHLAFQAYSEANLPGVSRKDTETLGLWGIQIAALPDLKNRRPLFQALYGGSDDQLRALSPRVPYVLRAVDGSPVTAFSDDSNLAGYAGYGFPFFSSDGRTLLVSLKIQMSLPNRLTCAVDAQSGRAVTNRDGQWRVLAESYVSEGRGGVFVGEGVGRTTDEDDLCNSCSTYAPIHVFELTRHSSDRSLLPARFDSKHVPRYGYAETPTLSPDGRTIAFFAADWHGKNPAAQGIWLVDRHTRHYRRLTQEQGIRQMRWESRTSLLVLKTTALKGKERDFCLYRVPFNPDRRTAGRPMRILENVDRFQLVEPLNAM